MGRAGIYVRISQDREGAGLGVARQEEDCRRLCAHKGWHVEDIYSDNDTGAYTGRPRPQWQRLVTDVKTGSIDAIAVWHVDRLTRSPRELEDVIDLADRHGIALATVTGEIDLGTPTGRMVARILGAAARHESEHKAERQIRQRLQAAEAGRDSGGPRPYGYAPDRVTIVESEAAIIRECAARILAGESLGSVLRDLNERGVPSARGGKWSRQALRKMLTSARISGRREHIPTASYSNSARPVVGEITADAAWPAIIAPADSDRLRSLLTQPARHQPQTGRKYLLSGILVCGVCQTPMVVRPRGGAPRYVCNVDSRPAVACGRLSVDGAFADRVVRDMVLVALESDEFRDRLYIRAQVDPAIRTAIADDEGRLVELAEEWADPHSHMTRGEWRAAREKIESRLASNRRILQRAVDTLPLDNLTGSYQELLPEWERRNVSQQRAIVSRLLTKVVVTPARQKFDIGRFHPEWRA